MLQLPLPGGVFLNTASCQQCFAKLWLWWVVLLLLSRMLALHRPCGLTQEGYDIFYVAVSWYSKALSWIPPEYGGCRRVYA